MSSQFENRSDSESIETRLDGDLKTQIFSILQLIRTPSAFAYSGVLTSEPNPALYVPPHGFLGLPLSADEAQKMISQASRSPFGKGEETLVDTTIRKCWELNPDQFSLKNPAWSKVIAKVVENATTGLGLEKGTGKVSAELYKLLLYEPGAFFKPHKDSEKAPGMFATLVICLPSPHEGGKVVMTLNDEKYEFETARNSIFNYSYAVWYADITHEVLPVVSGYRLMLTYNLIRQTSFEIPAFDLVCAQAKQLSTLLEEYDSRLKAKDHSLPPMLLHKLEHKYTEANLRLNTLKPRDLAQVQTLAQLSNKLGFDIYLAVLELTILKDDEYDSWEERSQALKNIVKLDGSKLSVWSLECPEGASLDPQPQGEGKADEEDHPGFTGNASAPAEYWYRDTVVVLVPPSKRLNFEVRLKLENTHDYPLSAIEKLMQEFSQYPSQKPKLEELCELAVRQKPVKRHHQNNSEYFSSLVKRVQKPAGTALALGRMDLFDEACKMTENKIILDSAYMLGCWAAKHGVATMTDRLMKAVRIGSSVAEKVLFLKAVAEGFGATVPVASSTERLNLKHWSDEAIFTAAAELTILSKDDCVSLAQLCQTMDWNQFELKAKPIILETLITNKITFIKELMTILQQKFDERQRSFIEMIIRNVWTDFVFDAKCPEHVPQTSSSSSWSQRNTLISRVYFDENDVRHIVENTITVLSSEYVETLIIPAMLAAIPIASKESTKDLFISLVLMILTNQLTCFMLPGFYIIPPDSHKRFVQALLTKFLMENVGHEPQVPTDWSLPVGSCGCDDCSRINKFLLAPRKEIHDFPCALARREHLTKTFVHSRIFKTLPYDVTTIDGCNPKIWRITKHRRLYQKAKSEWTENTINAIQTLSILESKEPVKGRLEAYLQPYYTYIMNANLKELPDLMSLVAAPQLLETNENIASTHNQPTNQNTHKRGASDIRFSDDLAKKTKP